MLEPIADLRDRDPACIDRFPYWRGFLPGAIYLDDVNLVRIALRDCGRPVPLTSDESGPLAGPGH